MSHIVKKQFKKSSININSDFDIYQLERKSDYLLDCQILREQDKLTFEFYHQHERPFEEIKSLSLSFQYQALLNIQYILKDAKRIKISLNPNNLTFDVNMMPKAIMRDIYEDQFDEQDFVHQYKSLIGHVLQNKYTFNDYYQGGQQLLSKNKNTSAYAEITSFVELIDTLNKEYKKIQDQLQKSMIEVDRKKYSRMKIGSRVLSVLFVITLLAGGYLGGFRLLEEKTFNKANEEYIKQDYISVMETLENVSVDRMSTNTKYILATSNIKTEALTDEQKNNILSSVTLNADERILEFWIYLGKSDHEQAIDIAKQLGNKEYIAYGYMKEKSKVENDKSLSGTQREEKLKEIESYLDELDINSDDLENEISSH